MEALNKSIAEENKAISRNQADLENSIKKTIRDMEVPSKPVRKKSSLSDLVDKAASIEKKNKK